MLINYWQTAAGRCPVQDVIETLPPKLQASIVRATDLLEEFGMNLLRTKHFEKVIPHDLYALRVRHKKERWRILVIYKKSAFWLVHIFHKQTGQIPQTEINTALGRGATI